MKRLVFVILVFVLAPTSCLLTNEWSDELPPPAVRTVQVVATEVVIPITATAESSTVYTPIPEEPIILVTPTDTPTPQPGIYVVKEGETLSVIAESLGVSVYQIAVANGIIDPDMIYKGQILTVPDPNFIPTPKVSEGKVIVVSLSLQKVFAFEDDVLVKEFIVSTGLPNTPTVLGDYPIYLKLEKTRMTGEGYDLADVPWTMYFFKDYGLHGKYWHNNFGTPMSHGCVNLRTEDAKWLFDWAPLGTIVNVVN